MEANIDSLKIHFENCYGIKKLEESFSFIASNCNNFVIYSPNGTMKTSFAKTFADYSQNLDSLDIIFPEKHNKRIILKYVTNQTEPLAISSEEIFVIEPYNDNYESSHLSTLLVNPKLKKDYEAINSEIEKNKDSLLKELKKLSGIAKEIENHIIRDFNLDRNNFYKTLCQLKEKIDNFEQSGLKDIKYSVVVNVKVINFMQNKDFKHKLQKYIEIYDELVSNSSFFKKGVFDHNNASNIEKSLKTNKFFRAKHTITITQDEQKKEIKSEKELVDAIEAEKKEILENEELSNAFFALDTVLDKNKELIEFRNCLFNNQFLLPLLADYEQLKQNLWLAYLAEKKDFYINLMEVYSINTRKIEEVVQKANSEKTKWQEIIEIFNDRFFVPFDVKIDNKSDAILGLSVPSVSFEFKDFYDEQNKKKVPKADLMKVLSRGEQKALYILNIIFEIETRIQSQQKSILIIDDIADSFDYKNKYAIIEYLKEISNNSFFRQIILTHNFDFYRTVCKKLGVLRPNCLQSVKSIEGIKIIETKYQKDVFNTWIKQLPSGKKTELIALIPFVRNIAEYTIGVSSYEYELLTSLLHIKADSYDIKVSDFIKIIKSTIANVPINIQESETSLLNIIFETAEQIIGNNQETLDLEEKIVLSIAIRLKAEIFMFSKLPPLQEPITSNQTYALFERFSELFLENEDEIKILKRVNLMTPDNIHLNSFMYEPILDMSKDHLVQLYKDILL